MSQDYPKYIVLSNPGQEGWIVERFPTLEELEKWLNRTYHAMSDLEIYEVIPNKLTVKQIVESQETKEKKK